MGRLYSVQKQDLIGLSIEGLPERHPALELAQQATEASMAMIEEGPEGHLAQLIIGVGN